MAQVLGRDGVLEVGDGLVLCPHSRVVGDDRALARYPDPVQVGVDLDSPSDHGGVDGVVVGVDADVVVARKAQALAPADLGRDRRQGHHGGLVRCDPVRRRAAQHPHPTRVGLRHPLAQLAVEVLG